MSSNLSADSFSINTFSFSRQHYTDARRGINVNYIARMLKGTARLSDGANEISVEPDEIFFIPVGCRYQSWWSGDEIVWNSLGFAWFPNPANDVYPLQKIEADDETRGLISAAARFHEINAAAVGLIYTVLARLQPSMRAVSRTPFSALVDEATRRMSRNPELPIAEIARACSVSESGLYAAFRQAGTTPVAVRQQLQIDRAVSLLTTTDRPVEEICGLAGFNSAAYFYRLLKKLTGKTSREIRGSALF